MVFGLGNWAVGGLSGLQLFLNALDRRTKKTDLRTKEQKALDKARSEATIAAQQRLKDELMGMNREEFKNRRRSEFELNQKPRLEKQFARYGNARSADFLTAMARAERQNEAQLDRDYYETLKELVSGTTQNPLSEGAVVDPTLTQALGKESGQLADRLSQMFTRDQIVDALTKKKPEDETSKQGGAPSLDAVTGGVQ